MINRHLAPVSNPIVRFRFIHTDTEGLRKAFEREITEKWESWRSRKSQVKIARIDSSLAEEDVDFTRVKFMIKKRIQRVALFRRYGHQESAWNPVRGQ